MLEQDPLGGLLGAEGSGTDTDARGQRLARLRRLLPPAHDAELYEM